MFCFLGALPVGCHVLECAMFSGPSVKRAIIKPEVKTSRACRTNKSTGNESLSPSAQRNACVGDADAFD